MIAALCAAAAVLLLAAGVAKIVRPHAITPVIAQLLATVAPRAPRRPAVLRPVARAIGVGETAVAVAVLTVGGAVPALLLAVTYAALAVVALTLAAAPEPVSCGCFGRDDTPMTAAHVVVNLLASAVAVAGVARPVPAAGGLFDDGVALAFAGALLVGLLAWSAYLVLTGLPALSSARRLVESS